MHCCIPMQFRCPACRMPARPQTCPPLEAPKKGAASSVPTVESVNDSARGGAAPKSKPKSNLSRWTKRDVVAAATMEADATDASSQLRSSISRRPNVGEKGAGGSLRRRGSVRLLSKTKNTSFRKKLELDMIVADYYHTPTAVTEQLKLREGLKDLPWGPLMLGHKGG